jgi:hypothetical protein
MLVRAMWSFIVADIQPIFLPERDREVIRKYLDASSYHSISNEAGFKALDSIDALQMTLRRIAHHIESVADDGSEINGDLIMNWISKPHTQLPNL